MLVGQGSYRICSISQTHLTTEPFCQETRSSGIPVWETDLQASTSPDSCFPLLPSCRKLKLNQKHVGWLQENGGGYSRDASASLVISVAGDIWGKCHRSAQSGHTFRHKILCSMSSLCGSLWSSGMKTALSPWDFQPDRVPITLMTMKEHTVGVERTDTPGLGEGAGTRGQQTGQCLRLCPSHGLKANTFYPVPMALPEGSQKTTRLPGCHHRKQLIWRNSVNALFWPSKLS